MQRIYFSAYQKGLGDPSLPAENQTDTDPSEVLTREHRLYQVDFLMRRYGFKDAEIIFGSDGRLSLDTDPKEVWAKSHPEAFPINVNRASKHQLLRVPGLGPITVNRILKKRRTGKLTRIRDIGKVGVLLGKAQNYLTF
jgi:predicted DNA-binding helix-hairpin-helix protein